MMTAASSAATRASSTTRLAAYSGSPATTHRRSSARSTQVVEQLREYEDAGVERVMLQHLVHEDVEMVAVLGEVAAHLR